ncbi:MAG: PAS-domain containing protein [Proteobacteria bacterium]|nr:PAS-domain containing protein [Pseudomonadota bacterium]
MAQNDIRNMVFSMFSSGEQDPSEPSEIESLRIDNALMRAVINNFPGGIALYDSNLRLVLCNDTLKTMLDYPEQLFAFGRPTMEQIFRFNANRGEYGKGDIEKMVAQRLELARLKKAHVYERKRPNGMIVEVRGVPIDGGGFITTYLDVSERKLNPHTDGSEPAIAAEPVPEMVSLPEMKRRIDDTIRNLPPNGSSCVHFLDLDDFRMLRHMHGDAVAENIIKEASARLRRQIRQGDIVASAGNDKFVILQNNLARPSDVTRLASRVIDAIRQPVTENGKIIFVSCSIGFALIPRDGRDAEALLSKAQASLQSSRRPHNSAA